MHSIETFSMPRYHEIPNVGLYLKQVVKYINDYLNPYFRITVTETMLSNYVKMHMVPNPVKKQYSRDSIAMLIFITLAKSVLPLEDIQYMLKLQGSRYALVIFACPVLHPPNKRHSAKSSGPAARCIAPSTPPPPKRELFAAFTIA